MLQAIFLAVRTLILLNLAYSDPGTEFSHGGNAPRNMADFSHRKSMRPAFTDPLRASFPLLELKGRPT